MVKVYLTYAEQLARIAERGMSIEDEARAMRALKGIGYYRLSAYTYPFRLPPSTQDLAEGRERSTNFAPGTSLDKVLDLYEFDSGLRTLLLRGLQKIEVAVGVRIAYALGRKDAEAHLSATHLGPEAVARREDGRTNHDVWKERYAALRDAARNEDFIKHHQLHYDGRIPIWVAIEFLDFGSLVGLFGLMESKDRRRVAETLGLTGPAAPGALVKWLRALNVLRNHCAHNNRVWNRSMVFLPPRIRDDLGTSSLMHLNMLPEEKRRKLYLLASLISYLEQQLDPLTQWPDSFRTQLKKFPNLDAITPESTMGFPQDWLAESVWRSRH